jgi:CRP-like cAMP-binding protein
MPAATESHLTLLKKTTDAVHLLSGEDWPAFADCWQELKVGKKEVLTVPGKMERHLYFVVDGVQRIFYLDDQDREATLIFTYGPSFGGVIDSLLLQQSSKYYYETLSPSTFLAISHEQLFALMKARSGVNEFVQKALTLSLSGLLQRMTELQCFSSEEKFRALLRRSPHILQLVPQKYLANYIGIDATNFSKLMNSVRI